MQRHLARARQRYLAGNEGNLLPELLSGPRPLFEPRPSMRKLVVVADSDLLASPGDHGITAVALLTGLLTHPYVKLLRYRDEGPAEGLGLDGEPPKGWACLLPPDGGEQRGMVYAHDSGGWTYSGVSAKVGAYARADVNAAYRNRPPEAAADQRERDTLAADVAAAVEADLFITERPYLFEKRQVHLPRVTLCRVPDALAMVSLYLRSQREFILWRAADGSGGPTANEWLYYQIGAVALLPELWRWSGAQPAVPQPEASEVLRGLTAALQLRIVRALRTRDAFHRALNLPQQRDPVRTVMVELDTILVILMGAVDASARFIHVLLAFRDGQRNAGWQKDGWRSRVAAQAQPLADLFARGTPLMDVLTILSKLRNTVHGQAIQATMRHHGQVRDAPITLPAEHEGQVLTCMDNLGGRAAWGAQPGTRGGVAVDPGQLVEQLFPAVLRLLNSVMTETPAVDVPRQQPDPDSGPLWYSERNRQSVSWQLGFESP